MIAALARRSALVGAAALLVAVGVVIAAAPRRPRAPSSRTGAGVPMSRALDRGSRASTAEPRYGVRAHLTPAPARIGQRLDYVGSVFVPAWVRVRFEPPTAGGEFTWGPAQAGREGFKGRAPTGDGRQYSTDSVWVRIPLQIFASGRVAIPGPKFRIDGGERPTFGRFPTLHVLVQPTITAADSNPELRPLRGPLAAPWWERVPWLVVAAVAAALATLVGLVARFRRRKSRVTAPAPVVPTGPRRSAADEALAALARLRAERLPMAGRFSDHAFELTRILRRFLEATLGATRPGDTSRELIERLASSRLSPDDVRQLEGLLGVWDRVKFARAPLTEAEAERAESAVEAFVRRSATPDPPSRAGAPKAPEGARGAA